MKKMLTVLLLAALLFTLVGCDSKDYKAAEELFAAGDYAAAADMYRELGDYEDSVEKVKRCEYELAAAQQAAGDYAAAREAFLALGDYSDSAEKAKACGWELGQEHFTEGRFAEAAEILETLDGYAESAMLLQSARDFLQAQPYMDLWYSEIDIGREIGDELDRPDFPPVMLKLVLSVQEMRALQLKADEESLPESVDATMAAARDVIWQIVEEELGDIPMETLLSAMGAADKEEAMDMLMESSGLNREELSAMMAMDVWGEWALEGDGMRFTFYEEDGDDESVIPVLSADGNTLTLPFDEGEELIFTR